MSVFSITHWIKKGYTEEEAKYQIAIRRPNNILYYINKGFSEEESKILVSERQKKGGNKRKSLSLEEKRKLTPRCLEFWLEKGLSQSEAEKELSNFQIHFSKEICIKKYGKEEGLKIWKNRQDQWQKTLNSKSPEEIKQINTRKNRWNNLSVDETLLIKERISNSLKEYISNRSEEITKQISNKIVKTKIELGYYLPVESQTEFEQYKKNVWIETNKNNLSLLENYELRGRNRYHLDHMYSICQGFKDQTPCEVIGHICNLKMIPYTENISKYTKCSITLNDLLQLIKDYNDKI